MERTWQVAAWNLNHRARQRAIPSAVGAVIAELDVDIVLLNEFVDGPGRGAFREQLASLGFEYQLVSTRPAKNNQVFAASRTPISIGDLPSPTTNSSAIANWLHIHFDGSDLELIGLRVPAYTRGSERRAYHAQLAEILRSAGGRPLVIAGDLNVDPFAKAGVSPPPSSAFRGAEMFSVPLPAGDWSYINHRGTSRSRLDHVLHSASVQVSDVRYHYELGNVLIAGPTADGPLSDHAALTFTVTR